MSTAKRVYGPAFLGTTAASLYQSANANGELIKEIVLNNTSTSQQTASIYLLPSGVAAVADQYKIATANIAVGSPVVMALTTKMENGDSLWGIAGNASTVTATITNYQE